MPHTKYSKLAWLTIRKEKQWNNKKLSKQLIHTQGYWKELDNHLPNLPPPKPIYGFLKLHKNNIPLDLLSSVHNLPYLLSKYISNIINNVIHKNLYCIKDLFDSKNSINNITMFKRLIPRHNFPLYKYIQRIHHTSNNKIMQRNETYQYFKINILKLN